MELGLLGPFRVLHDGKQLPLGGPRQRAVLAVLALNVNSSVPRDRLIELVWGGEPPVTAAGVLQTYIANLRKVLEPRGSPYQVLVSRAAGYELRLPREEAIDVHRFAEGVRLAREALAAGDPARAEVLLSEVLALWRGPALGEFASEAFALAAARRWEEQRLAAIEDRSEARLALGRHQELVPELRSLFEEHPLRERLAGQLMLALYRSDCQSEASDVYQRTRARLVEETGMEPGANLQRLLKRILNQDSALAWSPPASASTRAGRPTRTRTTARTPAKPVAIPVLSRALCPVLVRRSTELAQLEGALTATLRGQGRVVILAGDAGVGKTRLAWELAQRASKAGCAVMAGSCSALELTLPYLPFLEALGNYLASTDMDQLGSRLGTARRELAQLFPRLGGDIPPAGGGDPAQGKLRLFEAVLEFLRIAADENGLLLVIEDLQWTDASTRELLDYLSRRLRNARILVLATYRREELHTKHPLLPTLKGWQRSGLATVVELRPLPPDGVADMMRAILGEGRVTDELRDFMHARTEGIPFVLEEMLKAALDSQDIFFSPDQGIWDRNALEGRAIPPTLRDTILERVSRLNEEQIEVVRIAAVLGRSFAYQALVAVSGLPEQTLRATLRECVQQQLMEAGTGQDFRFRHALTQEAIYEDLLAPERAACHGRAAAALRAISWVPAAEVAHHLVQAGLWEEAVPVLMQAAEEAESGRGYHEAADLCERALPHVADALLHARLLCRQGEAYYLAGEPARAQPRLEKGISLLEQCGLTEEPAKHRLTLGSCHWMADRLDLAGAEWESARASLEPRGPSETLAHVYHRLAWLYSHEPEAGKGVAATLAMSDMAIRVAEAAGADAARIWGHINRGGALCRQGSVEAGVLDLDRGWREALERGLNDAAGVALSMAIMVRTLCFRVSETAPLFDRLKILPDLVHPGGRLATWICFRRAVADIFLGEMPSARTAALEGLQLAESALIMARRLKWLLAVAECALGRDDDARSLVQELQPRLHGFAFNPEVALMVMRVYLDTGEIDRAVETAAQALHYLEPVSRLVVDDVWLLDKAVEVSLAAEMPDHAERLRLKAEGAPTVMQPLLDRIEGRMALFRGDLPRADERISAAAQFLQERSCRDEEWRTRRVLAEVRARRGDRRGAEAELRSVIEGAQAHGHSFEAQAARKQLQLLGVAAARHHER